MGNELDLVLLQIQQLKYDPKVLADVVLSMPSVGKARVKYFIILPKIVREHLHNNLHMFFVNADISSAISYPFLLSGWLAFAIY